MNSIKLFDFKYMKEMLKKSKGLLIFFIIIIPIFNVLILLSLNSGYEDSAYALELSEISIANIILMYIIPLVLANIFFGFVYKKKSTDFMLSMPINRKTIFITGIVSGLVVITAIQLLNCIVLLICSKLFSNIIIFTGEIFDSFIMMWVSYVFVFAASSLALTISGNEKGQILLTILIIFLVPVLTNIFNTMARIDYNEKYFENTYGSNYYDLIVKTDDGYKYVYSADKVENYTMPFKVFKSGLDDDNLYSGISIAKMLVLSIIYIAIALKLFEKRKMENNEMAFSSMNLHLIIKAVTVAIILAFINMILSYYEDIRILTIAIIVVSIGVYYFVYDYIIGMKVPIKTTAVSFLLVLVVAQIGISGIRLMDSNFVYSDVIDIDDIKGISLSDGSAYYALSSFLDEDTYFTDEKIIEKIVDNMYTYQDIRDYYGDDYYMFEYEYVDVKMKLSFGRVYEISFLIPDDEYDELVTYIFGKSEYAKNLKQTLEINGKIKYKGKILTNRMTKAVNEALEESLVEIMTYDFENNSSSNYYWYSESSDDTYLYKYIYINHKIFKAKIPVTISDEVEEIFTGTSSKI